MFQRIRDLTGQVFGRLTVVRLDGRIERLAAWLCQCECGRETRVRSTFLTKGHTRSCGCLLQEARESQGDGRTKTAANRTWHALKGRCLNPRNHVFKHYGARGIRVCERWRESFEAFFADMGERPEWAAAIDRINNDGHYSCGKCAECVTNGWPANCRWATMKTQCRNRRSNVSVTADGATKTIAEWCETTGIGDACLEDRLRRGVPPARAVDPTPLGYRRPARHPGSKLTEDDVRAIRASTEDSNTLAARYDVSRTKIYQVRKRTAWAHVA